jgi:predicted amidohydrolase
MKIFLGQHDIVWEDKAATCARVRTLLTRANVTPGALVILPEMFATGFSMDVAGIAEGSERVAETFLQNTAREFQAYVMGGVVNLNSDGRGRNEAVVFGPDGREVARYCKTQPFAPGGEAQHYVAGPGPQLFDCGGVTVAPFVCYDLRFPEIFRPAGRAGAQLMTVIASWPDARLAHWVTLLQARAIENQCWVAGVNRVGSDPQFHYSGRSLLVSPLGKIVADAGETEGVATGEIDLAAMAAYRQDKPFLADMRAEFVPVPASLGR